MRGTSYFFFAFLILKCKLTSRIATTKSMVAKNANASVMKLNTVSSADFMPI